MVRGIGFMEIRLKLLTFSIIFLIISITPVSAGLMSESYTKNSSTTSSSVSQDVSQLVDVEGSLNSMEVDISRIEGYINSLNEDATYLNKRTGDYGWKFWKWPKITQDILKTLLNIQNNFNNVKEALNKINDKSNTLNPKITTISNGSYVNNVNNPFCEDDACQMARELTKTLNTTFTVRNISVSELHEGDIVQYLSEGKYPRYLAVQKKLESKNSTQRQLLGNTPIDISSCVLKGTGDKIVEVPLIGKCIQLVPINKIDTYETLQKSVQIQQNSINNNKKQGKNLEKTSKKLDTALLSFVCITGVLGGVSLILLAVALSSIPIPPISAPIMIAFIVSTGIFALSGVIATSLYLTYRKINDKAHNLKFNTILNQKDLNTYTKTEKNNKNPSMNITTFDGIPIIKKPPIPNWKELQFTLIEKPLHGDLLPGPGLQFLYNPHDGYSGNDTFKFQYNDKYGKIKGNMTVNIQIKPIPVFTLENNERITKPDVNNPGKEYDNIYGFGTSLLTVFDEASNTELTNEQEKYLETHENRLLSKAEAILYNLQNFLNILLMEYYLENTTTLNENKRNNENILDKYNATELWCTLEDLNKGIGRDPKDPDNETKIQKIGTKHVIIHGKDSQYDCMESVGFINITGKEITYQKAGENKTSTYENFMNKFKPTKDKDMYSITVFDEKYSTQEVLTTIYTKKDMALDNKKDRLDNYKTICTIFAGAGGIAVAVAGAYRLCDYCNSQTRQRIIEIIETPEEATPLVQPNGLVKRYARITEELHNNQHCNKCTVGVGIVTCGTLILIGSVIGFVVCIEESIKCKNKLKCLKDYNPR